MLSDSPWKVPSPFRSSLYQSDSILQPCLSAILVMRVKTAMADFSGKWREAVRRRLKNEAAVSVGGGEDGVRKIDDRTRIRRRVGVAMLILYCVRGEMLLVA